MYCRDCGNVLKSNGYCTNCRLFSNKSMRKEWMFKATTVILLSIILAMMVFFYVYKKSSYDFESKLVFDNNKWGVSVEEIKSKYKNQTVLQELDNESGVLSLQMEGVNGITDETVTVNFHFNNDHLYAVNLILNHMMNHTIFLENLESMYGDMMYSTYTNDDKYNNLEPNYLSDIWEDKAGRIIMVTHLGDVQNIIFKSNKLYAEEDKTVSRKDDNHVIEWRDKKVEKAVRDELNKPYEDITIGDLKHIEFLVIEDPYDISNLSDILYIQRIRIFGTNIVDFTPLSDTYIENLRLEYCCEKDFTNMSPRGVQHIEVYGGTLKSLKGLEAAKKLKGLKIINCIIEDITAIEELNDIEVLKLYNNKISDLRALYCHTKLREVNLSKNKITNIKPLAEADISFVLALNDNEISDVKPLGNLINLKVLSMSNNKLTDIDALSSLMNLELINLDDNDISDIGALRELPNLVAASLNNTKVENADIDGWTAYYTEDTGAMRVSNDFAFYDLTNYATFFGGDDITVTVHDGTASTNSIRIFTDEGNVRYVTSLEQISKAGYDKLEALCREVFLSKEVADWDQSVQLEGFEYIGSYLLTNKPGVTSAAMFNMPSVYKITVAINHMSGGEKFSKTVEYYWVIAVDAYAYGNGMVDDSITASYYNFHDDIIVKSNKNNIDSWTFKGFESLTDVEKLIYDAFADENIIEERFNQTASEDIAKIRVITGELIPYCGTDEIKEYYNRDGLLVRKDEKIMDGRTQINTYEYNESGQLISTNCTDSNGYDTSKRWVYNEYGYTSYYEYYYSVFNEQNWLKTYTTYEYDSSNRKIKLPVYFK